MPPWKHLVENDRWALIRYIRSPRRHVRWCPGPLDQELAEAVTQVAQPGPRELDLVSATGKPGPIPTFPRYSQIPSRLILSGEGQWRACGYG